MTDSKTSHIEKTGAASEDETLKAARSMPVSHAYSRTAARKILRGIAAGQTVSDLCAVSGMPSEQLVYRWISDRPDFAEAFDEARKRGVDALVDQMLAIADGTDVSDGSGLKDRDTVQRAKLRIEVRKWLVSKLAPHKYGDRTEQKTSLGSDITERLSRALDRGAASLDKNRTKQK